MFAHVETWIFDLDNTLYHPSARLFDQINTRMAHFIMRELPVDRAEANSLRQRYWERYGTTLRGLIEEHATDPDRFLDEVHEIDLSALKPDASLAEAIRRLPGRKLVHTNSSRSHAARVLAARGLSDVFDGVYAIEDKKLVPKPQPAAYQHILDLAAIDPRRAAMIEDDARNLAVPKALGMQTVWICHDSGAESPGWVDRRVALLNQFLDELTGHPGTDSAS